MVVSKKCKVCTALNADNIVLFGEYFDKSLPILIEKISGIELDPRKANGVMICKLCVVQLLHAEMIISKLRNTLQRLTKIVKEPKPKTNSKEGSANTNSDKPNLKSKNAVERRKSVFLDDSLFNNKEEPKENIEAYGNLSKFDSVESKTQKEEQKANTLKEMVGRRSEFQNINEEVKQNGEFESDVKSSELKVVLGLGATSRNAKSNISWSELSGEVEQKVKVKTPKKVVRRKSLMPVESVTNNLQKGFEEPNLGSPTKFIKIADSELTPVKSSKAKPPKRKQIFKEDGVESGSNNLNKSNIFKPTPAKRYNSLSISALEESSKDMDTDKTVFTESYNESILADVKTKMLNCVICGKGFSQKTLLREHIESSHMGEKLKQCPNCSTEFRSQQRYESHVFSEKCKNFKQACQYPKCNRRFKTAYKMELHMQEKHSSSQQESEVE